MSESPQDPATLQDARHEAAPTDVSTTQADGLQTEAHVTDQDWAQALSEEHTDAVPARPAHGVSAGPVAASAVFPPLDPQVPASISDIDMVMDIPVQLSVELGRTRLTIKNILQLGQGSVVELDGMAGEPMDICVNGYLIAQGEVVVVDDKYGIRVTDIITPADRLHRLNQRR